MRRSSRRRGPRLLRRQGTCPMWSSRPPRRQRCCISCKARKRPRRPEQDHESVALQRERLSLSAARGRIRIDPRFAAQSHLRSEEGRRALRPLHRRMAGGRGRGRGDHAHRAPPDGDLRRSGGTAGAGRAGAADQDRAAVDPGESGCQPPPARARRGRDGHGGCALKRPARMRFVRGVPYEVLPANSNPVRMNERQWEAMDLIVKAWTSHDGPVSHEGRFFHHRNINIWPRPYQQPHPPIWVSTTTPGGAGRVGARGYVQATFLTGYRGTPAIYDSYRKGWREAGRGHDVPINRLAYAALVYAGESEAEARSGAEKLLWYMTANKVPLHFCYPPGYVPTPVHAQILRGAAVDQHAANRANATVDKAIEAGIMFAGTPDQVFDQVKRMYDHVGG